MPSIKYSTGIARNIAGRPTSSTDPGILTTSTSTPAMANTTDAYLRVMSGTVPSQNDIDLNGYAGWDRLTGSPSEILIERKYTSNQFSNSNINNEIYITWSLQTVVAQNSGAASWWLWSGYQAWNPADRGTNPDGGNSWMGMLMGDITAVGGGGSMTLADVNIVAGQTYELGPAQFLLPRSFTYV